MIFLKLTHSILLKPDENDWFTTIFHFENFVGSWPLIYFKNHSQSLPITPPHHSLIPPHTTPTHNSSLLTLTDPLTDHDPLTDPLTDHPSSHCTTPLLTVVRSSVSLKLLTTPHHPPSPHYSSSPLPITNPPPQPIPATPQSTSCPLPRDYRSRYYLVKIKCTSLGLCCFGTC